MTIDQPIEPRPEPPVVVTSPDELLNAVNILSERTAELGAALTVSSQQQRTTRRILVAVVALAIAVSIFGAYQYHRISTIVEENTSNAVQGCTNANSSRQANRALWTYIINLTSEGPETSPAQREAFGALLGWINVLYQDHDCDDLSRVYEIPSPPAINLNP